MKKAIVVLAAMLVVTAAHAEKESTGPIQIEGGGLDCTNASPITCGDTQTNSVGPGVGNVAQYGCTTLGYADAEEFVYELCVGGSAIGPVDLLMTYQHTGGVNDLDLFLLGSCNEADCIDASLATSGVEEINANLAPGTYYVVVDGWDGRQDGSPHSLSVSCQTPCTVAVEPATWGSIKARHGE